MPWQDCHKTDERLRFVARLLEGEKMAELCREFDISTRLHRQCASRPTKDAKPKAGPRIELDQPRLAQ